MENNVKSCVSGTVYSDLLDVASAVPESIKDSAFLITGADSLTSCYMAAALLLRNDLYGSNCTVTLLADDWERAQGYYGSLLRREDIKLFVWDAMVPIQAPRADYVIHTAGLGVSVDMNLSGTVNALDFAEACQSKAALVVSSADVYGIIYKNKEKISEEDSGYVDFTSPVGFSDMSKRAGETIGAAYCKDRNLNVKLARVGRVYGGDVHVDGDPYLRILIDAAAGRDITLDFDGAQRRSFCYASDAAAALFTVLFKGENAFPYNIAGKSSDVSIRDFAKRVCKVKGNVKLSFSNPDHAQEPAELKTPLHQVPEVLDSTRLKELGFMPKVDLDEGIKRALMIIRNS